MFHHQSHISKNSASQVVDQNAVKLNVARHFPITQNNMVAISLQHVKKEVSDEIDFWHVDKHENSIQIDPMIFDGDGQTFPKLPKH